ncbi:MAG: VWA domain-containing protein [Solirubrobacterales bacterium]|nr:VWA domain-containing protein [Solirubrobacterales bacterium]
MDGRTGMGVGGTGPGGSTDEIAQLMPVPAGESRHGSTLHRQIEDIVARLSIPGSPVQRRGPRGGFKTISAPFSDGGDEIDLDRTLEQLLEPGPLDASRVIVRQRRRKRRALALLVDTSGSMRGERAKTTVVAACALAREFAYEELAMIAFWSDAAMLIEFGAPVDPRRLLHALLALPGEGLTNLSFPLEVAARALAARSAHEGRAMLLSDCIHNAGPDPRIWAARLPRLDVLLEVSREHDPALGRDLAHEGRGRVMRINSYRDVAVAINRAFAP